MESGLTPPKEEGVRLAGGKGQGQEVTQGAQSLFPVSQSLFSNDIEHPCSYIIDGDSFGAGEGMYFLILTLLPF